MINDFKYSKKKLFSFKPAPSSGVSRFDTKMVGFFGEIVATCELALKYTKTF